MIKLFRKTRQNMIKDNKVIKYLLYAIGEIILVVIGILIALSINNSNELKKTRDAEKVYLKEIKSDLIQDTLLLSQVIKDHKWRIAQLMSQDSTIDFIFEEIIGKLPKVEGVSELEYIFFTDRKFRPKIGTYNSMISEGKSNIISNRKLFNNIQNIYELEAQNIISIGDDVLERSNELRNKYAHEIKYGDFGSPIKITDKQILADIYISSRQLNYYTRQSVLLKKNIAELIDRINNEYHTLE
ncbi:DUF6090 family protein [Winogradskyella aurantia]|uniref:Uncharacterized protein n=1 Tax=Winogradskyella aurantia TaxID=1915063 RepID=A0A265URR8_9FLAO|nr:DUF6090 family protein [Winogradskyella aurantia]OZV67994.1 hypothetical protein CA834_10100 [Winogradskyella aurantia]